METQPVGSVPANATGQADAATRLQKQRMATQFATLVGECGKRYINCTLDSFACSERRQSEVLAAVHEYVDCCYSCGLILYGPVGTGKDHLAFAVLRRAIADGLTVKWLNGQRWFGVVRDAITTGREEWELIADGVAPDLLCLSDPVPPVGNLTQHQSTMLYRLVDARYARGKATLCTVNVANDAEADSRIGVATWDRLCHDAWKIHCFWSTYRKPAREV